MLTLHISNRKHPRNRMNGFLIFIHTTIPQDLKKFYQNIKVHTFSVYFVLNIMKILYTIVVLINNH